VRTAGIILDQLHGAPQREFTRARQALLAGDHPRGRAILAALLQRSANLPLLRPAQVVIAGAPNVGKSSLVNALAGYQRSIVSPTPGTTRDVTTTTLALDGWPIELRDTAGMRTASDALESAGIEQARDEIASAELCLWLVDASTDPVWPESRMETMHIVVNKCDLQWAWNFDDDALRISATTGEGIPALVTQIVRWLVPHPPAPGDAILLTPYEVAKVENIINLIDHEDTDLALTQLGPCDATSQTPPPR
jgi:tRNA modification GTPase